jgi:hypothetical protein
LLQSAGIKISSFFRPGHNDLPSASRNLGLVSEEIFSPCLESHLGSVPPQHMKKRDLRGLLCCLKADRAFLHFRMLSMR